MWLACLWLSHALLGAAPAPSAGLGEIPALHAGPEYQRGVALGMYDVDGDYDYKPAIDAIAKTGATHVSVVVVYYQETVNSTGIGPRKEYSPTVGNIHRTLRYLKQKGLKATLFPIVHIITRGPGDWRGKIHPDDWNLWFSSYKVFIGEMAQIAQSEHAEYLVVGTEYVSSETMRDRWLDVITHVRGIFDKQLIYSANWDHFDPVSFWDAVDIMGVTAYHKMTADNFDPGVEEMTRAWEPVKRRLHSLKERLHKPLIITEIGYPSLDGANAYPWDETRQVKVDVEEQRRCYEAFARAFANDTTLSGIYWWIWFHGGGPQDTGFTPEGKPATDAIKAFFRR